MKILIETPRLCLREFYPDDAESMYLLNEDPEVIRYTGDPPFESVEAAREFISNYDHYNQHGFGRWSVLRKDTEEYIGWCGLKQHEAGYVDIGFRFFRAEWGKGYATEAAVATLKYGFEELGLIEIVGRAAVENTASERVLEKLGMEFWKRDECNGIENAVYYRIVKPAT